MKTIPSIDKIVNHFVEYRTLPYTVNGKTWQGDIFYSDIHFAVRHVQNTTARTMIYREVCDKLKAKKFWIHS